MFVFIASGLRVFGITAFFSILAYLWLIFVLMGVSKNVVRCSYTVKNTCNGYSNHSSSYFPKVEVWEAVVTFILFPILVYLAYLADKGFPWNKSRVSATATNGKQIELGSIHPGECKFVLQFKLGPLLSGATFINGKTRQRCGF